jgi:hypothetical protein
LTADTITGVIGVIGVVGVGFTGTIPLLRNSGAATITGYIDFGITKGIEEGVVGIGVEGVGIEVEIGFKYVLSSDDSTTSGSDSLSLFESGISIIIGSCLTSIKCCLVSITCCSNRSS